MPLICDLLQRLCAIFDHAYVSFRTLQPRSQWGAVRKSLQELIESASPAAIQAEASRCIGLDVDALREAAEYLQLQYLKLHESEAYLSPGEWERRSRSRIFEFEALSSLAEVTDLTKSRLMRLALAGKALELGRGALSPPRATPESANREHPRGRSLRPGRAVFT